MEATAFKLQYAARDTAAQDAAAVIVAAGRSSRMNGINKQTAILADAPVLVHSVRAFLPVAQIKQIVLVVQASDLLEVQQMVETYGLCKVTDVLQGGDCRAASVQRGLERLDKDVEFALVHDGARPLVTQKIIQDVLDGARLYGAATCGVMPKDTVKQVSLEGQVHATLKRAQLILSQTPQAFRLELYRQALRRLAIPLSECPDDCIILEQAGIPVCAVPGRDDNIKITTQFDLELARQLWKERER